MATVYEAESARAQTWVLTLASPTPLDMETLCGWALTSKTLFGMQVPSGSLIVSIAKPDTHHNVLEKLRALVERAGGDRTALASVKPLDMFHLEEWGCTEPYRTPKPPKLVVDSPHSKSESESEAEEALAAENEPADEGTIAVYNDRVLASKFEMVAALKPNSVPATITLDDVRTKLDSDLADLTDNEKKHLTILYHPKMLAATAEHLSEECANSPPKETIHWLTHRPEPLVVYKHVHRSLQR